MSIRHKLQSAAIMGATVALLGATSMAQANIIKRETVYHPHRHVKVVKRTVCHHGNCAHIKKRVKFRPNGTRKVVTTRCHHGHCTKNVRIRG